MTTLARLINLIHETLEGVSSDDLIRVVEDPDFDLSDLTNYNNYDLLPDEDDDPGDYAARLRDIARELTSLKEHLEFVRESTFSLRGATVLDKLAQVGIDPADCRIQLQLHEHRDERRNPRGNLIRSQEDFDCDPVDTSPADLDLDLDHLRIQIIDRDFRLEGIDSAWIGVIVTPKTLGVYRRHEDTWRELGVWPDCWTFEEPEEELPEEDWPAIDSWELLEDFIIGPTVDRRDVELIHRYL